MLECADISRAFNDVAPSRDSISGRNNPCRLLIISVGRRVPEGRGVSEWIFIDKQPIEEELFGIIGDIEVAVVIFSDMNKCR